MNNDNSSVCNDMSSQTIIMLDFAPLALVAWGQNDPGLGINNHDIDA